MNLEARLAAIEADLLAIKQRLGLTGPVPPPVLPPAPPPLLIARPSKEVAWGGYWVTRIGAVLVLLAAIFLAAYLSIYSAPAIRISELIAAAGAALGVAYWQQARGNLRFALVLHSLGDALVFFTAFAAYAFTATKVIDSVTTALVAQTLAAAWVCAHALHRRAEGSAVFALILLIWVAGFSLDYQHSATTLGYVAAIALIGAILRFRYRWNLPLAFSAVASPVLALLLAGHFSNLRVPLEITFGILPPLATLPLVFSREPLVRRDRTVCFLAFGANLATALILRYLLVPGIDRFHHQLLVEAGAFGAIAGLFAMRPGEIGSIRRGLSAQAAFFAALSAALYLLAQFPDERWTGLAILGLGAGAALLLRHSKRAVSGYAYLAFWLISQIWVFDLGANYVRFGSALYWCGLGGVIFSALLFQTALGEKSSPESVLATGAVALCTVGSFASMLADPDYAVPTLLALAVLAAVTSRKFEMIISWAATALIVAHLEVIAGRTGFARHWLPSLILLTIADAAVLIRSEPLRRPKIQALSLLVTLGMLGTLFYGFAHANLGWSATFVWVPLAAGTFWLGFLRHNPNYRLAALLAFGPCLFRLFADDLNSAFTRILAFFLLGIVLLGIGYLYTRLSRTNHEDASEAVNQPPAG